MINGINGRNAKHEADGGIRGRATPLTKDALAVRKADDIVDGQKIPRIVELGDQSQFFAD